MLVERYQGAVAAVTVSYLGLGPDAQDIGQETFIRFYQSLAKFRGDAQVRTYLTRIAINLCYDHLRKRKRHTITSLQELDSDAALPPALVTDDAPQAELRERSERIQKALQTLDNPFREVVTLRMVMGYSTRETAELLKLPEGTVLSRLARALKKLRPILSGIDL